MELAIKPARGDVEEPGCRPRRPILPSGVQLISQVSRNVTDGGATCSSIPPSGVRLDHGSRPVDAADLLRSLAVRFAGGHAY
jgi:hypothetical protein